MYDIYLGNVSYETGITNITSVPGQAGTACAEVSLDPTKYNSISPIQAVATVDWSAVSTITSPYVANAVQTRINGTQLTICAYITGGIRSILPRVMWIAFQENVHFRTSGSVVAGKLLFNTNIVSAALCAKLNVQV